ncbi:MAG: phage terminase small subunit P27 family [Bryobacterales bacterium]|nr:phage terminase small subunit P27 family [Bryobacterales bacterium]
MGQRGPIPKPSAIERAEGYPGKRATNRREPKPREVVPRCPAHLDTIARREWRRLVPILRRMRVLTEADEIPLANLCITYSTLIQAQTKLNETGILYKGPSGYVQQSPVLSIIRQSIETLNRLSREFGLTPAARTRIMMQDEAPRIDMDAIMEELSRPRTDTARLM